MAAKHRDIDALIRKKQAERERLMKQVNQIDVELDALVTASGQFGLVAQVRTLAKR